MMLLREYFPEEICYIFQMWKQMLTITNQSIISPWSVLVAGFQFSGEMIGRQTCPFSSILGWYIFVLNVTFGGLKGYSAGKAISILKDPLLYGGFSWKQIKKTSKRLMNGSTLSTFPIIVARWNNPFCIVQWGT